MFGSTPVIRRAATALLALGALGLWTANPIDAAPDTGCQDITVSGGGKLVHPSIGSIGPVAVVLPAGQYQLLLTSVDSAHETGYQTSQTGEQWFFLTDSGYRSPITPDLPEALPSSTFDMGVTHLDSTATITFIHAALVPGANSVTPSVTFRCVVDETPTVTTAGTTTTPASTTSTSSTTEPTTTSASTSTTIAIATTSTTLTSTPAAVLPTSTVKSDTVTTPPTAAVDPEESPGPHSGTLPSTGSDNTLAVAAAGLLATGLVLVVVSRRHTEAA